MVSDDQNGDTDGTLDSKVARLIEEYELGAEFGDRLEELWTAEGDRRESLRDLADRFNRRVLESAMDEAGMSVIDGEIANLYRLLTSDEVSSGNRTQVRRRLEQNGIDVEQLERDFVTYQAIRSYLKEYRGTEYTQDDSTPRVDNVIETIQRLKARTRAVAEKSLHQLREKNRISIGEFRLFIDINILCEDCNVQYGVVELLREGSCECELK